ncbi:MAG: VWA domain-containing protein [Lentisphaerales bacterium]|nr:VWA domain-containing protein [Lentisphaerales bacterium]
MNFSNFTSLFFLLPLLALPFIIHIFNKKFPQRVPFPDIRLIKKSINERSKLFRLRHIILMALRTLVILLLLFCFMQPWLSKFGSESKSSTDGRNVLVLLDNTLSMQYGGGGITPRQQAMVELEKIVGSCSSKDHINLVSIDHRAQVCFDEPSINHNELLAYARSLPVSLSSGNINTSLKATSRQINKVDGPVEVYIISDFQRSNFSEAKLNELNGDIKLFFVDVSTEPKNNRAITGIKIQDKSILAGKLIPVDVSVANYSDTELEDRLEIRVNDKDTHYFDVKVAPWSLSEVRVEIPILHKGIHFVKAILSPDDMPQDNSFNFNLNAQDKEEIILLSDTDPSKTSANFLIQSALNPYKNLGGALLPKLVTSQSLAPMHLATSSKVFISSINRLPDETATLLSEFMKKGGSVIYFMDGEHDAFNLQNLEKKLPVELPFKAGLKQTAANLPGGHIKIRSGYFKSRYLKLFRGEARKRLGDLDFYEYYQARPGNSGKMLLTFSEGTPAMAGSNVGFGHLLLCNFSIRESGSNVAAQKVFPAWIHEIAQNMSNEAQTMEVFEVGQSIQQEVWSDELKGNSFYDPEKQKLKLKTRIVNDERLLISFTPQIPGHFTLHSKGRLNYAFPVNCSPDEADLRKIDVSRLPTSLATSAYNIKGKEHYEQLKSGQKIFHWFLLAGLTLLIGELFLFRLFRRLAL